MTHRRFSRSLAISVLSLAMLVACSDKPETLLASARDYMAKNDNKAAVIQIKNALQQDPDLAEARFLLGKALLDSGDVGGAEVELGKAAELNYAADQVQPLLVQVWLGKGEVKKVLEEVPKMALTSAEAKADAQTSLAIAHAMQGARDKAQEALTAALAAKPDFAPALLAQARLKLAEGDQVGALKIVNAVIDKAPADRDAWLLKGNLLTSTGDREGGMAAYRKAIEIRPDTIAAHAALVESLFQQQKLDEAGKAVAAMKTAVPNHPQTLFLDAQLAYLKKEFKRGNELTQQLLGRMPENPMLLQLAGAIEYQLKTFGPAETHLSKALLLNSNALLARRLLILIQLRKGDTDKALSLLEPLLGKIDKSPDLLALAGQVYLQKGDTKQAETYFAKAVALKPEDTAKQTALALTHMATGHVDAATGELERLAAEDEGVTADQALIVTLLQRKEYARALQAIDALEKKQPDNPAIPTLRGRTLAAKGDFPAARQSLEKALAKKPDYFPAAATLAGLDLRDKKPDQAMKRFESVLAADPKNAAALLALADLKLKTRAKPEAVEPYITKAVSAAPTSRTARLAQVNFYLATKQVEKALTAAQEADARIPENPDILDALGRAQQAKGDMNGALATYGKIAGLQTGSPLPYLRKADVNLALKDKEAAKQNLRKALQIKTDLLQAQRGLILVLLSEKKIDEANSVAREVQKQRPKEGIGYALEGDIAALKKAWPDAAAAYRNALQRTPSTDVASKLHAVLLTGGKPAEADKFAAEWLTKYPKDARFRLNLAQVATARKEFAVAAKHYQALLQVQPDNAVLLNNLAWVAGQQKDPKALEYAEKANKLAPNQPAVMDTLAVLLADAGQTGRALELLQKAVEQAPKANTIKLNLAKVQIKAGKQDAARKTLDELAKLGNKFPAQAEVAALQKGLH